MAAFSLDSSCIVAAVCGWHAQHAAAARALERRLAKGDRLVVAAHALVEAYAVLTRLPAPHRLTPADAWELLEANFVSDADVAALSGSAHAALLATLSQAGIGGGLTYDALIATSARHGKAAELLTFNRRHFDSVADDIDMIEP
ncbi:MAG TPA: PIN domain-containing protein [Vicinamibacterales bacterium]|nr:PIN domain-containing protein [Vicinamibacterales bacterium]